MEGVFRKLWQASPGSVTKSLIRKWHRLTARPQWKKVLQGPLAGAELFFLGEYEEIAKEMTSGTYDNFFYTDPILKRVLSRSLCWDVGAHFGYHSLAFASLGGRVVAFEPNAENAARLKLNLQRNPLLANKIRLRHEALSDHDGIVNFFQSNDLSGPSSGSHLAHATKPLESSVYRNFQPVRITARQADSLIADGEEAPQIIKVDVEGAELLMLQGARELLKSQKPVLLIEVHHINLMFHIRPFLENFRYTLRLAEGVGVDDCPSRCFMIAS